MTILLNSIKRTHRLIKRWSSLNQSEVDKFAAMSSDWWDQVRAILFRIEGALIFRALEQPRNSHGSVLEHSRRSPTLLDLVSLTLF